MARWCDMCHGSGSVRNPDPNSTLHEMPCPGCGGGRMRPDSPGTRLVSHCDGCLTLGKELDALKKRVAELEERARRILWT